MWTYDGAGNILSRTEYAYNATVPTANLTGGTTVTYTYGNSNWGDLLTQYGNQDITYDTIGNMLSDEEWRYTWEHGRQLARMSNYNNDDYGWDFTYDAGGMRTQRSNGSTTYKYVYNGSQLTRMQVGGVTMQFIYGATGAPVALIYNGHYYYYVTNIQGDVIAILNDAGEELVTYTYDAWGNVTVDSNMGLTLGDLNPLRYRGYVYDAETGLYYLQSRYYNPEIGRFINADKYVSTGTGLLGYNMFAYCNNNPVMGCDPTGEFFVSTAIITALIVIGTGTIVGAGTAAFITACDGGTGAEILEAAIEGALTGGTAAALGYFLTPGVAFTIGLFAGAAIDGGVQLASYQIRNGTLEGFEFNVDRIFETALSTGFASGIPGLNDGLLDFTTDIGYAIGTAIYSSEASVLISAAIIIKHKIQERFVDNRTAFKEIPIYG